MSKVVIDPVPFLAYIISVGLCDLINILPAVSGLFTHLGYKAANSSTTRSFNRRLKHHSSELWGSKMLVGLC